MRILFKLPKNAPKRTAPKPENLEGALEKWDAQANTFTVGGREFKQGKRELKLLVDGKEKSWAEFKEGDKVTVSFYPRHMGACIAKSISKGVAPVSDPVPAKSTSIPKSASK